MSCALQSEWPLQLVLQKLRLAEGSVVPEAHAQEDLRRKVQKVMQLLRTSIQGKP